MQLIDILVRELKEWPVVDGVAPNYIVQEFDGGLFSTTVIPRHDEGVWIRQDDDHDVQCGYFNKAVVLADDYETTIVSHDEWEAARTRAAVPTIEGVTPESLDSLRIGTTDLVALCHYLASRSGWWTDRVTGQRVTLDKVNVAEKLCLIHSEISEAMEGHRKNLNDDHLPHRKMLEVELADAVIRIGDLAGYLGLDLGGAIVEKLAYNQLRQDHKFENRQKQY